MRLAAAVIFSLLISANAFAGHDGDTSETPDREQSSPRDRSYGRGGKPHFPQSLAAEEKEKKKKIKCESKKGAPNHVEFRVEIEPTRLEDGKTRATMTVSLKGDDVQTLSGSGMTASGKTTKSETEDYTVYTPSYKQFIQEIRVDNKDKDKSHVIVTLKSDKKESINVPITCKEE